MFKEKPKINYYRSRKIYKGRIIGSLVFSIAILIGLIGRFAFLDFFQGRELKTMADNQFYYKENLGNRNYKLLDCYGRDFTDYKIKYYVVVDPHFYLKYNRNKDLKDIKTIKYILRDYNKDYNLPDEINKVDFSKKLTYEVDSYTYKKLKTIEGLNKINGLYAYEYNMSVQDKDWNITSMLSNKNDLKNGNIKSKDSLEYGINEITKDNEYDQVIFSKDVVNNLVSEKKIYPQNNSNIKLTIDKELQENIKKMLNKESYKRFKDVGVVLMESDTGKIRAMVQKDYKRPNIIIGAASNHGYFPGSIFKVITEEAGIDKNIIWTNKVYERNKSIIEHNNKPFMTVREALMYSSNDIFYQIGEDVGYENIFKYAKSQGLLDKVLNLYSEVNGKFEIDNENITIDQVKHSAIGQKIRITPLEALSIPNSVITGGIYVKPQIIDSIVDCENKVVKGVKIQSKRVMKRSTADLMKNNMIDVVMDKEGTGKNTMIKDTIIGGKTGTSEYFENDQGKIKKHSDGWFVGFFKVKDKYYSMVVLVRDIDWEKRSVGGKEEDGGSTAVPIFKEIVQHIKSLF